MLNAPNPAFLDALTDAGVTVKEAAPTYLEEPRGLYHAAPGFVALPRSVDEVATLVKACNAASVGIVPYGGGTGLVGGQVSPNTPSPLIVSLERMSAIRTVDAEGYTFCLLYTSDAADE